MAHPVGEKLHCDACGAEIVYLVACNCPPSEQKTHSHVCCNQEMKSLGVEAAAKQATSPSEPRKSAA